MECTVNRIWPVNGVATTGTFEIDGSQKYYTIERAPDDPLRIPAGRYALVPYHSPRFQHLLAEMSEENPKMEGITDVPRLVAPEISQRDPIEIHVANKASDVEGCIGIGLTRTSDSFIGLSREAVEDFYPKFMDAVRSGEAVFITVAEPIMPSDPSLGVDA